MRDIKKGIFYWYINPIRSGGGVESIPLTVFALYSKKIYASLLWMLLYFFKSSLPQFGKIN